MEGLGGRRAADRIAELTMDNRRLAEELKRRIGKDSDRGGFSDNQLRQLEAAVQTVKSEFEQDRVATGSLMWVLLLSLLPAQNGFARVMSLIALVANGIVYRSEVQARQWVDQTLIAINHELARRGGKR
jgi:hypothetical protein